MSGFDLLTQPVLPFNDEKTMVLSVNGCLYLLHWGAVKILYDLVINAGYYLVDGVMTTEPPDFSP